MKNLSKKILVFAALVFSLITNAKNDTLHSQNKIKFRIGAGVLTNIGQTKNFHYYGISYLWWTELNMQVIGDYDIIFNTTASPLLSFACSKSFFNGRKFYYSIEVGENIFYSRESYNIKGTEENIANFKYPVERKFDNILLNNTTYMNFLIQKNWTTKYIYGTLLGIGWNNIIYYKRNVQIMGKNYRYYRGLEPIKHINFNLVFNLGFDFSYRIGKLNISNRILFSPQFYRNQFISSLYYNFPTYNYHTFFITIINL